MTGMRLHLLGPVALLHDGAVVHLHSAKTLALLAFLALEHDRPHARGTLAGMLWGGAPEASARQSLRQALHSLRTAAGGALQRCIEAGHESVRVVDVGTLRIDVREFLDDVDSLEVPRWERAAARRHAPFLDGPAFDVDGSFGAWRTATRHRLHAAAMHNLERLAATRMSQGDWHGAMRHAEALRALDPAAETASRQLFRIHAARGEPQALEAEWARLCAVLRQEFGAAPSAETAALHRALRASGAPETSGESGASGASETAGTRPAPGEAGDDRQDARGAEGAGLPADPGRRPTGPRVATGRADAEALVRAARAAEQVHAFSQAADLYARALALPGAASPARRCEILLLAETALERLGRRAEQVAVIDEALAIAAALGDEAARAAILLRRAGACAYLGRHADALAAAAQALALQRRLGDAPGEAEALRELGFVHWRAGRHADALQAAREALALHRRLGDPAGEASALHNLAEIHRHLGSPGQAIAWYGQALRLHWAARHPVGEILSLFGLARALQQAGDLAGAERRHREALALTERHGERAMRSRALHALAMLHAAQPDLDAALALMRRAIDGDRAIGYAHALGHDLVDLADIHCARGERGEARMALREALVWFGFTEDRNAEVATQERIAALDADLPCAAAPARRHGVPSHLPLAEGKVYCEFESPLAR